MTILAATKSIFCHFVCTLTAITAQTPAPEVQPEELMWIINLSLCAWDIPDDDDDDD